MKKIFTILLAGLMTVSLATSCKKELPKEETSATTTAAKDSTTAGDAAKTDAPETTVPETEKVELKAEKDAKLIFWTSDMAFGEAIAEKFTIDTGIPVSVEEVGLNAMSKIALDGPSGNGGDVFMAAHDTFTTGYMSGQFQEFDPSIAERIKGVVSPKAYKTAEREGKLYGVPVTIETSIMLYNKALVEGEPAATMEQIFEEAKTFNDLSQNKFRLLLKPSDGYVAYSVIGSPNFKLFGEDGSDNDNPGFNTPEFEKGLELLAKLKEMLPVKSDDLKNGQFLDETFKTGKAAYYPNGPWAIKPLVDAGVDLGACVLPTYDGNPMTPFAGVQNAHVSAYTKFPIASQLFAEYLVSEDAANLLYEKVMKITSRSDISNVKGLSDDEIMKVFVEQFKTATPMPSAKRVSYYWTIAESTFAAVFDGTITPSDAAIKAQTDFDALVLSE